MKLIEVVILCFFFALFAKIFSSANNQIVTYQNLTQNYLEKTEEIFKRHVADILNKEE